MCAQEAFCKLDPLRVLEVRPWYPILLEKTERIPILDLAHPPHMHAVALAVLSLYFLPCGNDLTVLTV